jgi:leucyl aminopeptidase
MSTTAPATSQVVAVPIAADRIGSKVAGAGSIPWAFLKARGFEAKPGEVCAAPAPNDRTTLYVGVGKAADVTPATLRTAAGAAVRAAGTARSMASRLTSVAPAGLDKGEVVRAVTEGSVLGAYRYVAGKSKPPKAGVGTVVIVDADGNDRSMKAAVASGTATAEAACLVRDLVNTPGGELTAPAFADRAVEVAEAAGVACTVHDEAALRELGFGGLLAVNRGSSAPARFVELAYDPPDDDRRIPTVALVGKGVTFDSGGLSIKPADGMLTMKGDMAGAAAVLGVLSACAARDIGVRVRGYMPLTDNMLGPDATRVGVVVRHYGGSTTEILNTDAEGRLILGDAIAWATESRPDNATPAAVVDLATLTGACIVALGTRTAGLFGNDDDLIGAVRAAADKAGEAVWPLPLPKVEERRIESKVADRKNVGNRYGGAIHAGLFLRDFVANGVPWAHLDIAGPAFNEDADEAEIPSGGTGFGVRAVLQLLADWD